MTPPAYLHAVRRRLDIPARLRTRILSIVGTALPLITSSIGDADLVGLAHLRDEMVHAVNAYGRHVRRHMATVASGGDAVAIARAEEMRAGCDELERAYQRFRARWEYRDGALNWPEYRLSAIVMMKQMRDELSKNA